MRAKLKGCLAIVLLACFPVFTRLQAADFTRIKAKAEKGDTVSQYLMGLEYEQGEDVPVDLKKSATWFLKASEQDYAFAQYRLAVLYSTGKGADYHEAFKWFLKAAQQGFASAEFSVAQMYANGQGIKKDLPEACRWYLKAAGQGMASAQHSLGYAYEYGEGVRADKGNAAYWYHKAAEQNYSLSQNNLGLLYANGDGVKKDNIEAYIWFTLAARQGVANAISRRRWLVADLDAVKLREANRRADAFIPIEPPALDFEAPTLFTQATDDALKFLLEHRAPIRLSSLHDTAFVPFQFVTRIYETNQVIKGQPTDQIQFCLFATHRDRALLMQTADGLPYGYATKDFFVTCDPTEPGRLAYFRGNGVLFRFDSQGPDFGLQMALPDPPDPNDDIDFNLAGVLTEAAKHMETVRYNKDTRTLSIALAQKAKLSMVLIPESVRGPFGIDKVVLERGGVTMTFTKFVLGKLTTQIIPEVTWKNIESLQLPMQHMTAEEFQTLSLKPPPGFPRNDKERAAVEKLQSILW